MEYDMQYKAIKSYISAMSACIMTSKLKWLVDKIFWTSLLISQQLEAIMSTFYDIKHMLGAFGCNLQSIGLGGCLVCSLQDYLLWIFKWPYPEFLLISHQILDI